MLDIQQSILFDYTALDSETLAFVQEKAQSIHARLKRTAKDIIAIGQDLIEVKAALSRGQFEVWLKSEFGMSRVTAHNFMRVATRFADKYSNFEYLPVSVLYELAAPSMPDTVIELVETGQIPATLPAIREAKREREQAQPIEGETEVVSFDTFVEDVQALAPDTPLPFPETWNHVDSVPFTAPLPDGKPVEIPESWKLPVSMRVETPVKSSALTALQSSESNEWFTPAEYVDAARELMGGIDVDPASNAYANQVVQATRYFTKDDSGLLHSWQGRIWLNPPYGFDNGISNQETWTHQLIERYSAGLVTEAVLLVNANTEAKWFQPLYDYLICLTNHRIRFYNASGDSSQPTQGNALVYFGSQRARFLALFSRFGTVIERARCD